jgi:hypothetical protein
MAALTSRFRAFLDGKLSVSQVALRHALAGPAQDAPQAEAEAGCGKAAQTVIKQAAREVREHELADKIVVGNFALPQQRFGVIVADPVWSKNSSGGLSCGLLMVITQ